MKTLADIKRAMTTGSKWHTYNHPMNRDMGVREVSIIQSNCFALKTIKADGSASNSFCDWPKVKDVLFHGSDSFSIIENDTPLLTYSLINNESAAIDADEKENIMAKPSFSEKAFINGVRAVLNGADPIAAATAIKQSHAANTKGDDTMNATTKEQTTKKETPVKLEAPTRAQLIAAGTDMNEKMGLDPAINVKIATQAIGRDILKNAADLDFTDYNGSKNEDEQISDDTKATLLLLGYSVPVAPVAPATKPEKIEKPAATKPAKVKSAKEMKAEKEAAKTTKKETPTKFTYLDAFTDVIYKKCIKGATFAELFDASEVLYIKHNGVTGAVTVSAKQSRFHMVLNTLINFKVLNIDKTTTKAVYKLNA